MAEDCHCLRMNHSFSKIDISLIYRNDLILPHYADGMKKAIMQEFQSYARPCSRLLNNISFSFLQEQIVLFCEQYRL